MLKQNKKSKNMAKVKNSPFFDDILEAEELAEEAKKAKVKKTVKEDDPIFLESQNIDNIKVFVEDGLFYIIGEHYGEEIIIRLSLKNLEIIKKGFDGVFTEIGKNIKL